MCAGCPLALSPCRGAPPLPSLAPLTLHCGSAAALSSATSRTRRQRSRCTGAFRNSRLTCLPTSDVTVVVVVSRSYDALAAQPEEGDCPLQFLYDVLEVDGDRAPLPLITKSCGAAALNVEVSQCRERAFRTTSHSHGKYQRAFQRLRRVVSSPVVSCRVVSSPVVSCRVVSCRVVSCRVVSCRVVSCRVV
jgi:hypothetical protein